MEPGWEKVPNWKCFLFIENKDYSYRDTWMILKWLERSRLPREAIDEER